MERNHRPLNHINCDNCEKKLEELEESDCWPLDPIVCNSVCLLQRFWSRKKHARSLGCLVAGHLDPPPLRRRKSSQALDRMDPPPSREVCCIKEQCKLSRGHPPPPPTGGVQEESHQPSVSMLAILRRSHQPSVSQHYELPSAIGHRESPCHQLFPIPQENGKWKLSDHSESFGHSGLLL